MKKVMLPFLVILYCILPLICSAEQFDDFEYYINNEGTGTITKCNSKDETIVIPEEIEGVPVTAIADFAFFQSKITEVEIPDTVTKIEPDAFICCDRLNSIFVSPNNNMYAVIDNVLFNKQDKSLICYPSGLSSSTYSIPKGILSIEKDAFGFCNSLIEVIVPNTVTTIGEYAFTNCENLEHISLLDSVTTIKRGAFCGCKSLMHIEIPSSVSLIEAQVFAFCDSLNEISVSIDNENYAVIDGVLFDKQRKSLLYYPRCFTQDKYTIPNGILTIEEAAFCRCSNLNIVELPVSLQSIGDEAFYQCEGIISIDIPDGVNVIGKKAFSCCNSLKSVSLPASVANIDEDVFLNSDNVKLKVEKDSYAEEYAKKAKISYEYIDSYDWLNS